MPLLYVRGSDSSVASRLNPSSVANAIGNATTTTKHTRQVIFCREFNGDSDLLAHSCARTLEGRQSRGGQLAALRVRPKRRCQSHWEPAAAADDDVIRVNGAEYRRVDSREDPPTADADPTAPPQLTPNTPGSQWALPPLASPQLSQQGSLPPPHPFADNTLAPGNTHHPDTTALGNHHHPSQDQLLMSFLQQNEQLLATRLIYKGRHLAVVCINVADDVSAESVIAAVLEARRMAQLADHPFVRLDIQATLILRKQINGVTHHRVFVGSSNTSLFPGRTMVFDGSAASVGFLRRNLAGVGVYERLLSAVAAESRDSLIYIPCLICKFFF